MHIPAMQYFWLAFCILSGGLIMASVVCLRKEGGGPTLLMLIGGISTALLTICHHAGWIIGSHLDWFNFSSGGTEPVAMKVLEAIGYGTALGGFLFQVGLLLFALGLRRRADRVAELEAILHELQLPTPPGR